MTKYLSIWPMCSKPPVITNVSYLDTLLTVMSGQGRVKGMVYVIKSIFRYLQSLAFIFSCEITSLHHWCRPWHVTFIRIIRVMYPSLHPLRDYCVTCSSTSPLARSRSRPSVELVYEREWQIGGAVELPLIDCPDGKWKARYQGTKEIGRGRAWSKPVLKCRRFLG